jgi:hypothetical protein
MKVGRLFRKKSHKLEESVTVPENLPPRAAQDDMPRESELEPRLEFEKRVTAAKEKIAVLTKEIARLRELAYLLDQQKTRDILRLDDRDPDSEYRETWHLIRKAESELSGAKSGLAQTIAAERVMLDELKARTWERCHKEFVLPYAETLAAVCASLREIRETLAMFSAIRQELPPEPAALTNEFDTAAARFDELATSAGAGHNKVFGVDGSLRKALTNAIGDSLRKAQLATLVDDLRVAIGSSDKSAGLIEAHFKEITKKAGIDPIPEVRPAEKVGFEWVKVPPEPRD